MRSRVFNITDTANATTVSRHSGSLKFDQSMISLSSATRVFIVTGATDMRKSFNGLYGIVAHRLHENPLRGHVFVFCNVSRNRIKLLLWDGSVHHVVDSGFAQSAWSGAASVGTGPQRTPPPW